MIYYYGMDQDLINLIKENNKLLKENLELSRKNTKKLKRVQSFMRRTFIAKISYWTIVVLITAGAVYAAKPYVDGALETYKSAQNQLKTTADTIKDPSTLFTDIGILNKLFDSR